MERLCAIALFVIGLGAMPCARAVDFTGSATLTTDYVWRGNSQTRGEPALQAGAKVAVASGLYASAWGTNVDFGPASAAHSEVDLALGWSGAIANGLTLDTYVLRYAYPSTTGLDWTEVNTTFAWREWLFATIARSFDALASEQLGTYVQFGTRLPLGAHTTLEASIAHYFLTDADYAHAQLAAVVALNDTFALRFTAHATDAAARRRFGDALAGPRLEAALQATF